MNILSYSRCLGSSGYCRPNKQWIPGAFCVGMRPPRFGLLRRRNFTSITQTVTSPTLDERPKAIDSMATAIPSLDVLLNINASVTALFVYAAYEAYQLSNLDLGGATELRSPWVEKVIQVVSAMLLLLLVAIALTLAYRFHYVV